MNLISSEKNKRTIIFSTQNLQDAEEFSDRIGIMQQGQLIAIDTPENIKNRFKLGYKLIVDGLTNNVDINHFRQWATSYIREIDPQ